MKVFYYTFGCKVNSFETAAMQQLLSQNGYLTADSAADADIAVINSCSVTANADRKVRQYMRRLRRENPDIIILLSGCLPQAQSDNAEVFNEADIVVGNTNRGKIAEIIDNYMQERAHRISIVPHTAGEKFDEFDVDLIEGHTRAFLKIQDGCDRYCAYCIVPYSRGHLRSSSLEYIERSAERFAHNGYREIVLSGINLASYGHGTGLDLADAVKAAASANGIERVRISSVEPDLMSGAILEKLAAIPEFCPHFHMSLQSGCDATLARMGRKYSTAEYSETAERIKRIFDSPTFTTDVMVGFVGETDAEFAESMDFIRNFGFIKCHIFPYSKRPGTRAAAMSGHVSREVKDARASAMARAAEQSRDKIYDTFIGKNVRVIVEHGKRDGYLTGYTDRYIPVEFPCRDLNTGDIAVMTVTGHFGEYCTAE